MGFSANLRLSVTCLGLHVGGTQFQRAADLGIEPVNTAVPAGQASIEWTKTDANTGMALLATGHGFTTGQVADVYWDGGKRWNLAVTVSGDEVTLDGGEGDDLPESETAVIVSRVVQIPEDWEGSDLALLIAESSQPGTLVFLGTDGALPWVHDLVANEPFFWFSRSGPENPLAEGTVTSVQVSVSGTTAGTFTMVGLQDAIS